MAAGTISTPEPPITPGGGGGGRIRKRYIEPNKPRIEKPVYHDEDIIYIFKSFLEVEG